MYLVDANIILYVYDSISPFHKVACHWWEDCLSNDRQIRLAWSTVLAFLRISTHPRLLHKPFLIADAAKHVESWFARPMVDYLHPTNRHWQIFKKLIQDGQANGNLIPDAHLAALAIEHGAILCTCDRDFSRFDGMQVLNPLI
ncbi:MAG: PIN domain-containing protein [Deltaproteobacteria bacterium]|nr:PIN domain-containing protein [Deltaproteobacteria bacterium]